MRSSRLLPAASLLVFACGPRSADVAMHEAIEAHREGRPERAAALYRRALVLQPRAGGAYNNLSVFAIEQDRLGEAIRLLEEEVERTAGSAEGHENRALVLLRLGRAADAEEAIEPHAAMTGLPATDPEAALARDRARLLLALARWDAGGADVEGPLRRVHESAAGDPASAAVRARARDLLALRAAAAGRPEEVAALLAEGGPAALRAHALLALGRPAEALALLASPSSSLEHVLRAFALHALGRDHEVAPALDAAGGSAGPEASRLRASLASARGDWEAALRHLEDAAGASGTPPPDLWLDRAVALARLGKEEEARLVVAGVLRDHAGDARARELYELLR